MYNYMVDRLYRFTPLKGPHPYIQQIFSHDFDAGLVEFDGYFYAKDEDLPVECLMEYSNETYRAFLVDVIRFEKLEETSTYSEIEDEDGSMMRVCFFPTHHIKLWFRIKEEILLKPATE
jgi:hypothetical protein